MRLWSTPSISLRGTGSAALRTFVTKSMRSAGTPKRSKSASSDCAPATPSRVGSRTTKKRRARRANGRTVAAKGCGASTTIALNPVMPATKASTVASPSVKAASYRSTSSTTLTPSVVKVDMAEATRAASRLRTISRITAMLRRPVRSASTSATWPLPPIARASSVTSVVVPEPPFDPMKSATGESVRPGFNEPSRGWRFGRR